MKRAVPGLFALILLFVLPIIHAQSSSDEEEIVRNSYAKFSFLCSVETVSFVAQAQELGQPLDQRHLNLRLGKTVPVFTLTNFETGPLASIASRLWGDFVTPESSATEVLTSGSSTRYYFDNGSGVTWTGEHVSWNPVRQSDSSAEAAMMARPVSKVIEMASPYWSSVPVTFTRYVAFTVDARLDDKSSGPHKAIFLFGTDSTGKLFVAENDLISGGHAAMWLLLTTPSYPAGFLQSRLRDTPAVTAWIRVNEMPSSSCEATKGDVCCSHGRCGISQTDLNRDLSAPLPGSGGIR